MDCLRCHDLTVRVVLEDTESSASCEPFSGWKCLLCGEVSDPGIEANRKSRPQPSRSRPRPRYGSFLAGSSDPNRRRGWNWRVLAARERERKTGSTTAWNTS